MRCADCECVVEGGQRVVFCLDACCCMDVPKAPGSLRTAQEFH